MWFSIHVGQGRATGDCAGADALSLSYGVRDPADRCTAPDRHLLPHRCNPHGCLTRRVRVSVTILMARMLIDLRWRKLPKESVMKKLITTFAVCLSVGAGASAMQQQQTPPDPQKPPTQEITLTGCLIQGTTPTVFIFDKARKDP